MRMSTPPSSNPGHAPVHTASIRNHVIKARRIGTRSGVSDTFTNNEVFELMFRGIRPCVDVMIKVEGLLISFTAKLPTLFSLVRHESDTN